MGQNKIKKLIVRLRKKLNQREIARYSSKYSKKIFTQHQLIVLCVLKICLKMDYRDFVVYIEVSDELQKLLDLKRVPHFTTLHKFLERFDDVIFDHIISAIFSDTMGERKIADIATDSTGFTSFYSSRYYVMRINRETTYRSFMKMTIAAEPKTQSIIAVKCRKGPAHDTKDFIPLLRKCRKRIKQRIRYVIADKAYDSSKNFYFIEKELKAEAIIPLRNYRTGRAGRHTIRKHRALDPNKEIYGKRNIAETAFSVIKRKFGGDLTSRLIELKKKEMKLKALAYNLHVLINRKSYFAIEGFLQGPTNDKYI